MRTKSKKTARILVVDDARATIEILQRNLSVRGYEVLAASSAIEAIGILESSQIDLVIADYKMPGVDGMHLTQHIRENFRGTEVVMITGYGSIAGAVNAMKAGADEYLAKPFTDEELFDAVTRALRERAPRAESPTGNPPAPLAPQGLIGDSEPMKRVFQMIEKARSVTAAVLISGESGTGKEMVARAIHYTGPRSSAPFVAVNCGAIPETLIESELFGYVKGAFTGADQSRAGYFQTAEGGTIFLDEISETSPAMQVKLLRALQEKEIAMVGSRKSIRVDARIIAATNKDLAALMSRGRFREDLFYRLHVLPMVIPPLREREDDILLLLRHFTARYTADYGKSEPRFSQKSVEILRRYDWPGNVRELENVVQRLVLMCESKVIEAPDLPQLMRFSALRGTGQLRTLEEVEAGHITEVLASAGMNKTRAARILGIDRKTLAHKLERMNAPPAS